MRNVGVICLLVGVFFVAFFVYSLTPHYSWSDYSPEQVAGWRKQAQTFCQGNARADCVDTRLNAIKKEADDYNWKALQARINADNRAHNR